MTEDTQKPTGTENEALIQQMLREAKPAEVSSLLEKNPIVHKGDAGQPAPMVVNKISSAGYYWVWDSRTFEKIPVLYYMLPQMLRRKRLDGSFRFTTVDPGQFPKRGSNLCMLHPNAENRKHYDELGFRSCNKSNITNPYQVVQHMKKRHPQEWAAIEEEKKQKERQEDRELQRLILGKVAPAPVESAPVPEVVAKAEEKKPAVKESLSGALFLCDACGADFGSQKTLDKHKVEQHTDTR